MSLISDVRSELRELDTTPAALRKFGLLVGGILLLIALLWFFRGKHLMGAYICGPAGILLILGGAIVPASLRGVYRVWMALAFTLGWFVSRLLLTLLFYLVLLPVGLCARVAGKEFMDINLRKSKESYWKRRESSARVNYEKMY